MKRYALTLKILLGIFASLAMVVILLIWRLSIGPITLDWAGEYLKAALSSHEKGVEVDFRDAVLIWQKENSDAYSRSSGLQVIFYEVAFTDKKNDFTLKIPQAGARFSGIAMLRGLLAPTDVSISGLSIDYTLDKEFWVSTNDKSFAERLEAFVEGLRNSNSQLFRIIQDLILPPKSSYAAGYLSQISFLATKITLNDQLTGQKWAIPNAQLRLQRIETGLSLRLFGDVTVEETHIMPIDMFIVVDNIKKEAVTSLKFSRLRPSALAGKVPALSAMATFNIPASGDIKFTIDKDFNIPLVAFDLSLESGEINPASIYPKPLKVTSAVLSGHIIGSENSIILEEISLLLGQTDINGSGLLYGTLDKPGIAIKADITDLPFLDLKTYWPGQFGKGAYKWIAKNIDAGIVPKGELDVYIKPDMWPDKQNNNPENAISFKSMLPADVLTFKFNFNNITAHYLRPMPILTNISGVAELNLQTFHMQAQGGNIEQLDVTSADLLFTDIHLKGRGNANITLNLDGTVEEILEVIDNKPLGYPSKFGIKENSITGHAKAIVSLQFPLLKKIKLKDVVFDVKADIDGLSIPTLTDSLAIQDGKLNMFVDGKGITAEGNITLNGVNFQAKWLEKFDKDEALPSKYMINGFIEGADWERLHLPFDPYIEGPVEIDLSLFGKSGNMVEGYGQFNLLKCKSVFAPIGWLKENDKAGQVDFDLRFLGAGEINIHNILLQSEGLEANLEIDLQGDRVTRFFLPKLIMKDTDIIMLMQWNEEKNYYLSSVTGKYFNAGPLIEIITASGGDEGEVNLPDFNLDADIEDILTKNNVRLTESELSATYRDEDFTHLNFKGKLPQGKEIAVTIVPKDDNRLLKFSSDNAGEALRGLGLFNIAVGGEIQIIADMVTHEHGVSLGGTAEAHNFKVIESPGLSKLLAEKKFIKAQEEMKKEGLSFNKFNMDFRTYNGVMEISNAKARGPMLGITIGGTVDQFYDEINISGTLIPADGINSLLSNIPLIGTILTGGKGQGIFAATYNINGSIDDPNVTINPLSALAPGILRSLFSAIGGKKKTLREQAEKMQEIIPNTKDETELDAPVKPE